MKRNLTASMHYASFADSLGALGRLASGATLRFSKVQEYENNFARAEGSSREEAESIALEKAGRYLKQTRRQPRS